MIQYRTSPWPKTAEYTGVTDGQMDGRTNGQTLLQRCVPDERILKGTNKAGYIANIISGGVGRAGQGRAGLHVFALTI